jgi:hypothetical protein
MNDGADFLLTETAMIPWPEVFFPAEGQELQQQDFMRQYSNYITDQQDDRPAQEHSESNDSGYQPAHRRNSREESASHSL